LKELGITAIEVMPIADFPGRFGWGYDGVNFFAPTHLYGTPDDLRRFVNRAHELGLAVVLDVVYNHAGPDGCFLDRFSPAYFSAKPTDWGRAFNFDGEQSAPVREFFEANARHWIDEYHFDGLRLDATQQIFDRSHPTILQRVADVARAAAPGRDIWIVAENEPQRTTLLRRPDEGGDGLDALWNDDFHHAAIVAATGRREAYYLDYLGSPQEFLTCAQMGFLYQGQWYSWQQQRRGMSTAGLAPWRFVSFLQNHDQIANSTTGTRLQAMTRPGLLRALTALLLIGPWTPMLFQGEEFASSSPFLYFADHQPPLANQVADGRRDFLSQFPSAAAAIRAGTLDKPHALATFQRCRLDHAEREQHGRIWNMHQSLLQLRRNDPVIADQGEAGLSSAVLANGVCALRFNASPRERDHGWRDRLLVVNLGPAEDLSVIPFPILVAAPDDWRVLWSSEDAAWGGTKAGEFGCDSTWRIPADSAWVLG
jgi:maltooligosyltrehalose trehalohydrolase